MATHPLLNTMSHKYFKRDTHDLKPSTPHEKPEPHCDIDMICRDYPLLYISRHNLSSNFRISKLFVGWISQTIYSSAWKI